MKKLLDVQNLTIHYEMDNAVVKAVNDVSFSIDERETLGLVGETGAGKTTTALGIMRLVPNPPGRIVDGKILLNDENLLDAGASEMRSVRGSRISMIFQDPMTSLNPVIMIGDQVTEVIRLHGKLSLAEATVKAQGVLELVGIPNERFLEYPHQFSGGMRQRVVIAMALACSPSLIIADEPTTALDVTIQAQVLELMTRLKEQFGTSMLIITHDLGVVAEVCDRVAIMYAGKIIEYGGKRQIFKNAKHPYTQGLFASLPSIDEKAHRLRPIKGSMPDPTNLPSGCHFSPRCPDKMPFCEIGEISNTETEPGHFVRCAKYMDGHERIA